MASTSCPPLTHSPPLTPRPPHPRHKLHYTTVLMLIRCFLRAQLIPTQADRPTRMCPWRRRRRAADRRGSSRPRFSWRGPRSVLLHPGAAVSLEIIEPRSVADSGNLFIQNVWVSVTWHEFNHSCSTPSCRLKQWPSRWGPTSATVVLWTRTSLWPGLPSPLMRRTFSTSKRWNVYPIGGADCLACDQRANAMFQYVRNHLIPEPLPISLLYFY